MSKKIEIVKIELTWADTPGCYAVYFNQIIRPFEEYFDPNMHSSDPMRLIPDAIDELDAYRQIQPILEKLNERLSAQVDPERTEAHEGEDGRG